MTHQRAFSLVEVLIVIALVVVLALAVAPQALQSINSARIITARDQARSVQGALDAWLAEQDSIAAGAMNFTPSSAAAGVLVPNNLGTFWANSLLPHLNPDTSSKITAENHSGSIILTSSAIRRLGGQMFITWSTPIYTQQPTVQLVLP